MVSEPAAPAAGREKTWKFGDEARSKIESAGSPVDADHWRNAPMDVKKPGTDKWLSAGSPDATKRLAYRKALEPVCPDGSATWSSVSPSDPDNGRGVGIMQPCRTEFAETARSL